VLLLRRPLLDELGQHARRLADHAPVRPLALDRRGLAGRPVGDHGRGAAPPPEHADPARLPEGEPGGPADPLPRAHLADAPALDARRVRRDAHGAAHLDGERRRAGAGVRRAEVRRARAPRPRRARQPGNRHRRGGEGGPGRQREPAHRHALWEPPRLHGPGHGPADQRRAVPARDRRLPQRLARAPGGAGAGDRQRRGRQDGLLVRQRRAAPALDRARRPAPARHQHGRGGRRRDGAPAHLQGVAAAVGAGRDPVRPLAVAYDGAAEIGFTILSMTLSLAAVFIPVLFMPGILGRLFHEFSVTICTAILISGCVSLTLTPMLCARYLRPPAEARHGRLFAATERAFDGLLRGYERSLGWVLRHRPATMGVSLALLAMTGLLFVHVPKGFIPNEDQGFVFTVVEAAEGVSFEQMTRLQLAVTDIVRADPSVEELFSSISASSASTGSTLNQGRMFLHLRPRAERPSA